MIPDPQAVWKPSPAWQLEPWSVFVWISRDVSEILSPPVSGGQVVFWRTGGISQNLGNPSGFWGAGGNASLLGITSTPEETGVLQENMFPESTQEML